MVTAVINVAKIFFLYSVRLVLPYLPLRALFLLGDLAGGVMIGKKQDVMRQDLLRLLGYTSREEQDAIILSAMQNFRKDLFEIWTFHKLSSEKINKMVYFEGLQHLDRALAKGKGAILCITHIGSHKIVIPALAYNGYRITQVAANPRIFMKKEESQYHNKIMELELESEASIPAKFFYVEEGKSFRPVYRALENNEVVLISLDGVIETKRMDLPFLKGEISLATGAASLSFLTGAPALSIFPVRQKDNRHRIIIHGPLEIQNETSREKYITQWMCRFAEIFEGYVKNYPEHYARWLVTIRKYDSDLLKSSGDLSPGGV